MVSISTLLRSPYLVGSFLYLFGSVAFTTSSATDDVDTAVTAMHAGNAAFVIGSMLFVADGLTQARKAEADSRAHVERQVRPAGDETLYVAHQLRPAGDESI